MNTLVLQQPPQEIVYPDSDGQPMAENTLQFRWIVTIEGGLEAVFADNPNVFVAGDLFWYPVEGQPGIRQAPAVMVVIGRPKGDRSSYLQWQEAGIPPQVVWEVLSPGNRPNEMIGKFQFYERHGVAEHYMYDPDRGELFGWLRDDSFLREIPQMRGWTSPRLRVTFQLVGGKLRLSGADGKPFATYLELVAQREQAVKEKEQALKEVEKLRALLKEKGIDPNTIP